MFFIKNFLSTSIEAQALSLNPYAFSFKEDPPAKPATNDTAQSEMYSLLSRQQEGYLRIASGSFMDTARYPSISPSSPESQIQLMSQDDLLDLPPLDDRNGSFRKNTNFIKGVTPSLDSFYFRLAGDKLYYANS